MSETEQVVLYEAVGRVGVVTLNRPRFVNALNTDLVQGIAAVIAGIGRSEEVDCLIVQGAGKGFCSGADLKERLTLSAAEIQRHRETLIKCQLDLSELPVPVIASCHGGVIAGGMEFALACDIRVATETSRWGLTEVRYTGAFPGALGPVRLEKIVGSGAARRLVFTGALIDGSEAYRLGIADILCGEDEREAVTFDIARSITENSRAGIKVAKQLMVQSHEMPMSVGAMLSLSLRAGFDGVQAEREAVRAWNERGGGGPAGARDS